MMESIPATVLDDWSEYHKVREWERKKAEKSNR